jgi:hypothetical protein
MERTRENKALSARRSGSASTSREWEREPYRRSPPTEMVGVLREYTLHSAEEL